MKNRNYFETNYGFLKTVESPEEATALFRKAVAVTEVPDNADNPQFYAHIVGWKEGWRFFVPVMG